MAKSKTTVLSWDSSKAPAQLHSILRTLGENYPIVEGSKVGAVAMEFVPGGDAGTVEIILSGKTAKIVYDKTFHAARGIGSLLAGAVKSGATYRERVSFETFGMMLDCSRNAVMTVEHVKAWLRQLALLGYNMAMLYTEDTYELPGEEYFGYLRGRYTADEMLEIDRYAAGLGVEMIACIQTLGHLEQILKWNAYEKVQDTEGELLVGEEATYALIEKMIAQMSRCYASRRIHVGMDEAWHLGRGRFINRFGYKREFDIFNEHLKRVVEICKKYGLQPMIWSDMYFRSNGIRYYHPNLNIPADVRAAMPKEASLVYWDYYESEKGKYLQGIARHRELGFEPVMASGVWTWSRLWYDAKTTEANATPCVQACNEQNVKDFIFTLWGDDGAYCEFDSSLAGLAYGAEVAYSGDGFDKKRLARRYQAICGADYQRVIDVAGINEFSSAMYLWDDPMLGIVWKNRKLGDGNYWKKSLVHHKKVAAKLSKFGAIVSPVDLAHGLNIAKCLVKRTEIALSLEKAYARRDKAGLSAVRKQIPAMIKLLENMLASFRRQWYAKNKTFGFEVIQIRTAGLIERYRELSRRLGELSAGKIDAIPELDEKTKTANHNNGWWRKNASGSKIV